MANVELSNMFFLQVRVVAGLDGILSGDLKVDLATTLEKFSNSSSVIHSFPRIYGLVNNNS